MAMPTNAGRIGHRRMRPVSLERPSLVLLLCTLLAAHLSRPASFVPIRLETEGGGIQGWEWAERVPTDRELRMAFPPIPVNLSVTPVVLIPGIGGSVLSDLKSKLQVWIRLYAATYYFQRYMWGKYNATTQTMETDHNHDVGPLTTGFGLDAIANLDPSVHWPLYDYLSYFDAIIKLLESQGWERGKTLFGVPWDWRQSMCFPATLDALQTQILRAQANNGGRKVSLVSHSMGGLVVRCLMKTRPSLFETSVERWVAVAAPHQGAGAKILLEFLQGYNLGNIVIDAEDAKVLSLDAPAVYELLPRETFAWVQPPFISVTFNNGTTRYFSEGPDVTAEASYAFALREALRGHTKTVPDTKPPTVQPQPLNEACWNYSQRTRELVAHAALPASVTLYSVVGVGQDTSMGLNFTGIEALDDLQTAKYSMISHDGDGTVPTESASQPLMPVRAERRVKADHMAILMHRDTLSFLLDALYGRV